MANIRSARVDLGQSVHGDNTEEGWFWFKVEDDDGRLLGTFCIERDGLFYFKPHARVLTPNENGETQVTYDGHLTFEQLRSVFEGLDKIGWDRDRDEIAVTLEVDRVVLTVPAHNNGM